jgi:hypothetical protein
MSRPASGLHGFVKLLIETVLCVTRANFLAEYTSMCYAPSPFRSCCETLHHSKHFLLPTLYSNYSCIYAVQHVSQAPPGRAKCPADPYARRRPKREVEGREPAAAGHARHGMWGSRGHFGGRCCLTLTRHRWGHNGS